MISKKQHPNKPISIRPAGLPAGGKKFSSLKFSKAGRVMTVFGAACANQYVFPKKSLTP